MIQWILMAVLTALAALAVVVPLARRTGTSAVGTAAAAVYRDQLAELDRDRERGLIDAGEADAARIELARRLLRASDSAATENPIARTPSRAVGLVVGLVGVPLLSLAVYLNLGTPNLPDQPLAARLAAPAAQSDLATLIGRVEQHLAANPDDGRGWEVLAPAYLRLGRPDDAVAAYRNAIRLLGSTAAREADLGEAIVTANNGLVTEAALAAFDRALADDPEAVKPRFYQALAKTQAGDDDAAAAWKALLADAAGDEGWVTVARAHLMQLEGAEPSAPGPDQAAIDAAGTMSPADRQAFVDSMVGTLAARLADDPLNPDGWVRLIRSYLVLGRPDEAAAALADARIGLAAAPDLAARFEAAVEELDVGD